MWGSLEVSTVNVRCLAGLEVGAEAGIEVGSKQASGTVGKPGTVVPRPCSLGRHLSKGANIA